MRGVKRGGGKGGGERERNGHLINKVILQNNQHRTRDGAHTEFMYMFLYLNFLIILADCTVWHEFKVSIVASPIILSI